MQIVIIKTSRKYIPAGQIQFYIELEREVSAIDRARELRTMLAKMADDLNFTKDEPSWDLTMQIYVKCKGLGIDTCYITVEPAVKELAQIINKIIDLVYKYPQFKSKGNRHELAQRQLLYTYLKSSLIWLDHILYERPDLLK